MHQYGAACLGLNIFPMRLSRFPVRLICAQPILLLGYSVLLQPFLPDLSRGILARSNFAPGAMLAYRIDMDKSRNVFPFLVSVEFNNK